MWKRNKYEEDYRTGGVKVIGGKVEKEKKRRESKITRRNGS